MVTLEQLCKRLKELREENNLLQSELAKLTGLKQATISNLERGHNFRIDNFITLYNYYCTKYDDNKVVSKLFNVSDSYSGMLVEQLKLLSEKTTNEFLKMIETLE